MLDALEIRTGYSKNVLIRMLIVSIVLAATIFWNLSLIKSIYFEHQIDRIGPLINGAILVLFGLGVIKLVVTYLRYAGEEAAIARFLKNVQSNAMDPLQRVAPQVDTLLQPLDPLGTDALDHGGQQPLLALEVPVEGRLRDARLAAELRDAGGGVALLREAGRGDLEQALAGAPLLARHPQIPSSASFAWARASSSVWFGWKSRRR